jgi:Domain of unknown function (DUF5642)
VVSTGVRPRSFIILAAMLVTACTSTPAGTPTSTRAESSVRQGIHVTPNKIRRVRADFPPGYEVADAVGARSPAGYWGFSADFTTDPPDCAELANPVTGDAPPAGLSGSGPGGIIYTVVAASASPPVLDSGVVAECPRWSMVSGRTTATVELTPAPSIDGVATAGMATTARTVVEGGTQTDATIQTVSAYLGDYLVFVAVVTDPGSSHPPLPPEFAATLLVKAVAALRG